MDSEMLKKVDVRPVSSSDTEAATMNQTFDNERATDTQKAYLLKMLLGLCIGQLIMMTATAAVLGNFVNFHGKEIDRINAKSDALQAKISKLQDNPGDLTKADAASMQDLKTKLLEIESKMEDTKTNTDTDFQVHLGKINQLEKDRSFHISLINDHEARIKQLDIEGDTNSNVIQKLNNTLTQLASDIVANEEAIQVQQTRFNEPESNRSLDQDILRCQSITDLLNSSIRAIETDMTIQTKTIQDHSLILSEVEAIMEQTVTFKDLNNSLLQLETIMVPLSVTVANHSISINQIHADLEKIQTFMVNISNKTTGIELDRQSDFAAIKANQRRISNLELTSNDTDSLYESMEYRLNYLEDGLNCSWGAWTSFSSCTATCGSGIQYRERSCNGLNPHFSDHWCSRIETDIQTCNIESCEPEWGEWSNFTECSQSCGDGTQTRNRTCINTSTDCSGDATENRTCNTGNCPDPPFDCKGILENGIGTTDGVYSVVLNETRETIQVYCDMTSDGGGWTVFQKRVDGSVDFYNNYFTYEAGFGSVSGEFWLGLKYIYQMTNGLTNEIRLDLEKSTGQKGYAVYQSFSLSERPSYALFIGEYSGTAGEAFGEGLSYNNGSAFTTYDRDMDRSADNCGIKDHGGWWYRDCTYANLNGEYVTPGSELEPRAERGVTYKAFDGFQSLKSTEMKFRRKF